MKLNLALATTNTGSEPFAFSCGFHPYLRVGERDRSRVRGLDGLVYFDGVAGVPDMAQCGDLVLDHDTDHIFAMPTAPKHEYALVDDAAGRATALVSSGNDAAVVWNPGPGGKLADLEPEDWRRFVCGEPVSDWPGGRTLAPGERHVLAASIQCTLRPGRSEG